MAVYVDKPIWEWRGKNWAHLVADTDEELHEFARKIGLRREWFQNKPKNAGGGWPHYDVTEGMRKKAIAKGAVRVSTRQMVYIIRRLRVEHAETSQRDRVQMRVMGVDDET